MLRRRQGPVRVLHGHVVHARAHRQGAGGRQGRCVPAAGGAARCVPAVGVGVMNLCIRACVQLTALSSSAMRPSSPLQLQLPVARGLLSLARSGRRSTLSSWDIMPPSMTPETAAAASRNVLRAARRDRSRAVSRALPGRHRTTRRTRWAARGGRGDTPRSRSTAYHIQGRQPTHFNAPGHREPNEGTAELVVCSGRQRRAAIRHSWAPPTIVESRRSTGSQAGRLDGQGLWRTRGRPLERPGWLWGSAGPGRRIREDG